ncbi:MAG: DNA topoisomerase III, partial [Bacteroidia bacterium]|nr:DNA topoisomerase III [Bacteroidia bacterium]
LISAELTGQWEKRLKEIEQGTYSPVPFIRDMKKMVDDLVTEVRMEKNVKRFVNPNINLHSKTSKRPKSKRKSRPKKNDTSHSKTPMKCPKCTQGKIIKGKTRFGCTQYNSGCDFAIPFIYMGKKLSDNQVKRLVEKGSTVKLKGFLTREGKVEGKLIIGENNQLLFEPSQTKIKTLQTPKSTSVDMPLCPQCKKGKLIKGKTAYGCSLWQTSCDFKYSFADIKKKAAGQKLTKELVLKIIAG